VWQQERQGCDNKKSECDDNKKGKGDGKGHVGAVQLFYDR
jgi:hypothetical protein